MKKSTKDVNDKLLRSAGFERDPRLDGPKFNVCGDISYWVNNRGLRIVTSKKVKISMKEFVAAITAQAVYLTKKRAKAKISEIADGDVLTERP